MKKYKEKILKGLLDFQKEIIQCNQDCVIMNGSRNSSKTFMIVKEIEYNRPKNVVIFAPVKGMFENIICQLSQHTKLRLSYHFSLFEKEEKNHKMFRCGKANNCLNQGNDINIYWGGSKHLPKDIIYDYAFFEEQFPTTMKVQAKKIFSTVTCRNYNNYIERFFPEAKIFNIDYHVILKEKNKLYPKEVMDIIRKEPKDKWYKEYAILDKEV